MKIQDRSFANRLPVTAQIQMKNGINDFPGIKEMISLMQEHGVDIYIAFPGEKQLIAITPLKKLVTRYVNNRVGRNYVNELQYHVPAKQLLKTTESFYEDIFKIMIMNEINPINIRIVNISLLFSSFAQSANQVDDLGEGFLMLGLCVFKNSAVKYNFFHAAAGLIMTDIGVGEGFILSMEKCHRGHHGFVIKSKTAVNEMDPLDCMAVLCVRVLPAVISDARRILSLYGELFNQKGEPKRRYIDHIKKAPIPTRLDILIF